MMQIIERLYKGHEPLYPIERLCPADRALFVDIETTGLKKETTSLYLIGCGHYTDEGFLTTLLFADSPSEENIILTEFAERIKTYTHILCFNGDRFDIPYLEYKAGLYGIKGLFEGITVLDIYKMCKTLRYLLFPDSMRQKAIENFLGIDRDDMYGGGELIAVYEEYVRTKSPADLELLITHNREDVLGMHLIMPILYYLDLRDAKLTFEDYEIKKYKCYDGTVAEEVIFFYHTNMYFPVSFSARTETMFVKLSADTKKIAIRLPIYTQDMKIYFENYRDYCYLPGEDRAILKSIASTLPKDRYQKATRQTCYQTVSGKFVKQPDELFTPVLKTDLKDKKNYFRFPDSFKKEAADEFGRQLLNVFFTIKKRSRSIQ